MKRTKQPTKATAILTADWHLREDTPLCRADNYWEAQWKKVQFVSELQEKHDCPVLHAGDLFNHWKPSPYLLSKTIRNIPNDFWTVYGNHDLPQNSLDMKERSGVDTLLTSKVIRLLDGVHWGQEEILLSDSILNILVWHTMTYQGKEPWPGCPDPNSRQLLRKYKEPVLILTGHNHVPFVEEYQGRILVNPGALMRMSADQGDFKPRVYLWYQATNTAQPVYLPIEENVISRQHIEQVKQKDERITAFVEKLNTDWTTEVSFRKNLENFLSSNSISANVESIIWQSLED